MDNSSLLNVTILPDDAMRITEPGAYLMSPDAYYADPCPSPSLTQSIIKVLIDKSPKHARLAHPRLNPNYESDTARNLERGTAAHSLLIGRGKDLVIIEAKSFQTKAAREKREQAIADGKSPVLLADFEVACKMVKAAYQQLGMIEGCERAFNKGYGELVVAWEEAGLWLRTQIDWADPDDLVIYDYKTTDMSAAPHKLANSIPDKGLDIQGGQFERALCTLDPDSFGKWRFRFVLQETEEPYALSLIELDNAALTMGRKKVSFGVDLWRRCVQADYWPGYPLAITRPEYPSFAESSWLAREEAYAAIVGTNMDPFHSIMGAAAKARSEMLTEITG